MRKRVIQVTIDEALLRKLDSDPEVRREGRSVVLRRAAAQYLRRRRDRDISEAYRRGYGDHPPGPEEFGPFVEEPWPDDR